MKIIYRILPLILLSGFISCNRNYPEEQKGPAINKEQLLNANKAVVHDEAKVIEEFITRHGWKMQVTGTGLRYEIYKNGKGAFANGSTLLTISYKAYLLDGTLCYEADTSNPLRLIIGKGQQINGLEEGLMMMNEGAHARFVIPNHLAYGITGDQDKIPPASALYYDVQLLKTETPQVPK